MNDDDVCPVDATWVASKVLVNAWRKYGHLIEPGANQELIKDATQAATWFSQLSAYNFRLPPLTFRPIAHQALRQGFGPGHGRR